MPRAADKIVDVASALQENLADWMFQKFNPALHAQMQMEAVRNKLPSAIRTDSRAGYSGLEDRILENDRFGFINALFNRNELFAREVEHGPLTSNDLDTIMQDAFKVQAEGNREKKGSL